MKAYPVTLLCRVMQASRSGFYSFLRNYHVKGQVDPIQNALEAKLFDALEWLAAMCSHVPGKGKQMVRYYGYYSPAPAGWHAKNE